VVRAAAGEAAPHRCQAPRDALPEGGCLLSRASATTEEQLQATLAWLGQHAKRATLEGLARFAIPSDKAFGVSVADLRQLARQMGPNHDLAAALWATDRYEARLLATFIDEPARVSAAQMDRWCKDFDSWALCDTACFALFDRTAHAWSKVAPWAARQPEFEKRAGFALLWALAVHDKACADAPFLQGLQLIAASAEDERNFVRKAVNMALRAIGKRNAALHAAATEVAHSLAASQDRTARWVGKDALRELTSARVTERVATPRRRPRAAPAP
jgi:3-methyladenine DNA glycosylase AlkD